MYKEQEIYQGLIDRGMSPHIAAGFTGNFVAESGLRTDISGDNGTSYGLAQWHNERKTALNNFSKGKKGSPLDIQLDFVMHELATTHKGVANRLKSAKNVDDASKIVTLYYEIPLDREKKANERLVHSRKVFSGGGGDYKPQKEEEEANPYTIDFGDSQVAKNSGDTYSVADYNEAEQEIEKKQTQENNENAFLSEMQQIQQNSQQQPMPNEPQQTYLQDSSLFQVGEFQDGGQYFQSGGTWSSQQERVNQEKLAKLRRLLVKQKNNPQTNQRTIPLQERRGEVARGSTNVSYDNRPAQSRVARNKTDEEIAFDRRQVAEKSDNNVLNGIGFLNPDNHTRQNWADATASMESKYRLSDKPNFFDEYLNVPSQIAGMGASLGSAPLRAQQEDSYMPYVTGVAAPMAFGALAGIGAQGYKQFANNVVNPLAGTGDLLKSGYSRGVNYLENQGIRTSIPDELRQGLNNQGFLDIFKSKISPKLEGSLKQEVVSKPFAKDVSKEDIVRFVHDDIDDMINTEEGRRRLVNMGIDPKDAEDLWANTSTIDDLGSDYNSLTNTVNISGVKNDSGMLGNNKTTASHEVGHWLQNVYNRKGKGSEEMFDALITHIDDNVNLAKKEGIPYADAAIKNESTDTYIKYKELSKKFNNTDLDRELLELYEGSTHDRGYFNPRYMNPKEYFFHTKAESAPKEPLAFAREFRQNMINSGVIEHKYDNITEDAVKSFMKDNANKISGTYDRLTSFSGKEHIKGLTDILNEVPAVAPIAGASYLATQGQETPPQYEQGGEYTENEMSFLREVYQQGGIIKDDNGYWNPDNWGKTVEIGSPNITMKGVEVPLWGTSKETGEVKKMIPGNEYYFKNTNSVIEQPITKKVNIRISAKQKIK